MVGPGRVERPTSRLSGVRSNHLSYEPETRITVFQDHFAKSIAKPETQHAPLRAGETRAFDGRKGNEDGGKSAMLFIKRCLALA